MVDYDVDPDGDTWNFEQQIVANIQDGLIVSDSNMRYLFWNSVMERISGLAAKDVLGKKPLDLFPFLEAIGYVELFNRAIAGETISTADFPFEVKSSGARGWASQVMAPLRDATGEIVGVITTVHDVTERVRIDDELRISRQRLEILSRQLLRAQEEERHHLARELHDEIGQVLTAIKISLNESQRLAEGRLQTLLKENMTMIDRAIVQVRNMSLNLRPAQLDLLGLVPALMWLFKQQSNIAHVKTSTEFKIGERKIPPDLEVVCFRIAQEALTNAIRHGKPSKVSGKLWTDDQSLFLSISDDGSGFNADELQKLGVESKGFGLLSMHERAALVGGQLKIESIIGDGTIITVVFSLPPQD
jgi:PAS domain S-box-containing protein